jgi:hypothetical protein
LSELGKLLDKDALEQDSGPRARAKIEVPERWAKEGARIAITLPKVLTCARCDGGGCDGCGRSGALRAPGNERSRVVRVRLPGPLGDGVAMRIADPFGRASRISQLWIEVRPAKEASPWVKWLDAPSVKRPILQTMVLALSLLVALIAGVLALMTWARR